MLPYLPFKKICSNLSNATDKLNLQRAVGQRLCRRSGPDAVVCPICCVSEFMLLAQSQSESMWFQRHHGGPGWENLNNDFVRVDRRLLETNFLNHCSLLARSKMYKNFTELRDHVLSCHQVLLLYFFRFFTLNSA